MRKLRAIEGVTTAVVVLTVLVLPVATGAAVPGVDDSGAVDAGGPAVASAGAELAAQGVESAGTTALSPTFGSSAVSEHRGDVVPIVIRMDEGASAELVVVGKTNDYRAEMTVSDDSRDGLVVVELNTFTVGGSATFRVRNQQDDVQVTGQSGPTGVLPAGEYRLLTDDRNEWADLTIESRASEQADTMVAPANASSNLASLDDVKRYREAGNLTLRATNGTPAVATGDTLVLRLKATGLSGALAVQPGDTVTERFRSLVDSDLVSLSVSQVDSSPDVAPARLQIDGPGVHVVTNRDSDAYFLVVDTATARYSRGDETGTGLPVDARFRANLTVEPSSALADAPESVTTTFRVAERSATVRTHSEAGTLWVLPERGQRIEGTTTLAPGSTLRVRVRSADGGFERARIVTVQRGDGRGHFETAVGFQELPEGTIVELTASGESGPLTDSPTTARVRSPAATLDDSTLTVDGATLQVTLTANLSRGGLVTVRADNASGRLLGVAAVDPGGERVSVPLSDLPPTNTPLVVRAVRDLDDDHAFTPGVDQPYEQADSPRPVELTIALYKTPPSPTATPTATATATGTTTGTAGTTPTGDRTATDGQPSTTTATDDGGLVSTVPGFGPTVAFLAVLAAVLVLRRRR